ncbi:kielin/chordin-like protein isoform X2 [Hippoglossus hippoglossus]|uniref:kielin/chordin-like protein isoform X2 n=1 Tax=Hippoglossus hippoglossus TaxID=8267 RepID=UPI00148E8046|nr:kielin/chordin-like protein isoform X2 [Hippoglossus hippoglossus]
MESGKLRTPILLGIQFLWVLAQTVQGQAGSHHENVIDLLEALNMSNHISGVSKLQSPTGVMYRIRPRAPHLTLPAEYSHLLYSNLQGSMGLYFVGHQSSGSSATLLSLSSPSSPILQFISSTLNDTLRLDYQAGGGVGGGGGGGAQGSASFLFPVRNPFSREERVQLAVSLEPDRLAFFVDCQEAVVVPIKSEEQIHLELPQNVVITLASTPRRKDSKFSGYLKTAEISMKAYLRRPWVCDNFTDNLPASKRAVAQSSDSWTDSSRGLQQGASPSKSQASHRPVDQTATYPQDVQSDQLQRGVALGPPASPEGVKSVSQVQKDDRLKTLEKRMEELSRMLDMVKAQNADLQSRVKYLEGCECVRQRCEWEGRVVDDGQRWQIDLSNVCTCTSGKVTCQSNIKGCELDGTIHNVSYSTLDGCQTCTCKGGTRECSPLPCPSLDCTQKETVPGDCCPQCKSCIHTGVRYDHKAKWRPEESPCDVCHCLEGRVHCEREQCRTPCKNPAAPPPNTCCPVCQGCGANGHDFPNGAAIPTGERCQECTCVNGNVACSPLPCPALSCRNPVHRAGDCCPRCEQCEYESKVYVDGQTFPSRRDPCLRCYCSAGEVSCERLDSSCPTPHCNHPAKRKGECCPTCDVCEYDRRVYAHGEVFTPAGSGPCLQCRCKGGNVICHEEKCPPVQCSNPIIDSQLCCPICKACVLEGLEYEEGSSWQLENRCSSCICVNGETRCTHTHCPPDECLHPTKTTGSCCATCESCTYNHRIYSDGQKFATPEQPCHICTCQHGTVACERRPCPPVNCTNSYTPPGECCAKCPDCSFENRVFVDGQVFLNPVSVCEECECVSGRIDCHQTQCPQPHCNAPRPGTCCQNNCNGCSHAGKEYPNGLEFPHPTDMCRTCSCINGNVQCLKKRCPPLLCSHPNVLPGDCCPLCPAPPSDCVFEQRTYRHTERFYHPTDNCRSCACTNGTVHCQRKPCPFTACSHPITQECCRTCEGCLHESRERANGETWDEVSDPCSACLCREGSVRCERKRCPPSNCNHPVQRQCCMSCDGCMFHGKEYPDGTEFPDDQDPCSVCYCYGGEVVCNKLPCYGDCSHPYKPPGQCCAECERCFYNSVVLTNGQTIPDPGNLCSECTCQRGSVRCLKKTCPAALCPHPFTNPCGCSVCDGCHFQGVSYVDGQILPGGEKGCEECTCSRGEVVCVQRRCPAVLCPHPAQDRCACGVCDGCNFNGRECFSGERFQHPTDQCQLCSCLNGGVVCARASCPSVACMRPVTPPGECCPVCTGICQHQGREYQSGSTFSSPSDPCSSCSCLNEVVNCQRRPCPVRCSHPVPSETCCPVCDSCRYEGVVHSHSHTFTPSSNPCQRCTCVRGTVTCVPLVCPSTPCARPVTKPGQCCPECTVCRLDGKEFSDGQAWTLSSNRCSSCTCQAGEVQCSSPRCPKLPCMHQVTDPGACCPRCRGCMYGGEEHTEGSSWFADSTPCMTCMCVDGVTTCSEVHCLSPCINFISVPGECCPVCADCVFEGRVYGPGDSFHPADDPCQICTCEVMPDGEQHLRCLRKQCPSLVDCPKSNILFSGPDSCCPVCAQPLSNCTSALIGNEVLATDDPCFTCHCKDLTWTCLHQLCVPVSCPLREQFMSPDSCCPVCKECVIEGQGRVANGSSWTDSDDDCVTCTCNLGYIECSIEECLPAVCLDGQKPVKTPGKCCPECHDSGVSCLHQGTVYHSNEQWEVDECTSCTCVSGDVHCHSERCPPLTCATDEMPAVVPGLCCPHCLPRPATCIAFGDPHYRTFDGRMLHFQGACTYVLAQDCEDGDFSVHVTNDDRGRKGVSWTKEVTVFIGDVAVQLLQDWVVKVNDEVVTLPFLREPYIYVERQTNTILLNTNIGLKVLWSGRSHLEVSVPGSYKGHTCGLCGNFNNYYQDDLRMPSGQLSLSESGFGNSWRVTNGSRSLSTCRPGEDVDPCKDAGYQAKKGANARCKVLKSAVFKPCHRVVPPEPWYGACVYDLCACGANSDECLCDALEAYTSRCREAGVVLKWRSPSLCAVGCPVERGFVFDECGPPCPVTCFNVDVPLGVIESHCFKPCVPGCQCPAGLVLHNNHCIQPEKCPKIIHGKHT